MNLKLSYPLIFFFLLIEWNNQVQIPLKLIELKHNYKNNNNFEHINSLISKDSKILSYYCLALDIYVGSNNQNFTILLDTGSEILWLPGDSSSKNVYIPSSSSTSIKSNDKFEYEYIAGKISGYYCSDQIKFLTNTKFFFYFGVANIIQLEQLEFDGILGLGRNYKNKKQSITYTMQNVGIISSTKFSFKYNNQTKSMLFILGEEHQDFKNKERLAMCSLIDSEIYNKRLWSCDIYTIGILRGNDKLKQIKIDSEGLFDTGTSDIILPLKYFSEFEKIFTNLNCYSYNWGGANKGVDIHCKDINSIPKLSIGLKNYELTIGEFNFYQKIKINDNIVYRIKLSFEEEDFVIIGQNFFFEYHTLFDDEKNQLVFYSEGNNMINKVENEKSSHFWIILIIIIGGCLVIGGVIVIIIYCCVIRKKKKVTQKELLELSSINQDMNEYSKMNNEDNQFNKIMNISLAKNK